MNVDHRGWSPLPTSLEVITLDATPESDLKWEVNPQKPVLWEFKWGSLQPTHIPMFQLAIKTFNDTLWPQYRDLTLGAILFKGAVPALELEVVADLLHQLGAVLPEAVPPFALFDVDVRNSYDIQRFSKELFSHLHLGFRHASFGALKWKGDLIQPVYHKSHRGVLLPLRADIPHHVDIDRSLEALEANNLSHRLIAEMYLTEEWDDLEQLIVFPKLLSIQGLRKVRGFEAAGGEVVTVGDSTQLPGRILFETFMKDRGRGI